MVSQNSEKNIFFKDRVIKSNQISSETQIERRSSQQGAVIVKVRCLKGGG